MISVHPPSSSPPPTPLLPFQCSRHQHRAFHQFLLDEVLPVLFHYYELYIRGNSTDGDDILVPPRLSSVVSIVDRMNLYETLVHHLFPSSIIGVDTQTLLGLPTSLCILHPFFDHESWNEIRASFKAIRRTRSRSVTSRLNRLQQHRHFNHNHNHHHHHTTSSSTAGYVYDCHHCGKSFVSKYYLDQHLSKCKDSTIIDEITNSDNSMNIENTNNKCSSRIRCETFTEDSCVRISEWYEPFHGPGSGIRTITTTTAAVATSATISSVTGLSNGDTNKRINYGTRGDAYNVEEYFTTNNNGNKYEYQNENYADDDGDGGDKDADDYIDGDNYMDNDQRTTNDDDWERISSSGCDEDEVAIIKEKCYNAIRSCFYPHNNNDNNNTQPFPWLSIKSKEKVKYATTARNTMVQQRVAGQNLAYDLEQHLCERLGCDHVLHDLATVMYLGKQHSSNSNNNHYDNRVDKRGGGGMGREWSVHDAELRELWEDHYSYHGYRHGIFGFILIMMVISYYLNLHVRGIMMSSTKHHHHHHRRVYYHMWWPWWKKVKTKNKFDASRRKKFD